MSRPNTTANTGQPSLIVAPASRPTRAALRQGAPTTLDPYGPARNTARALTATLWAIGSAYLVKAELATPAPDPVVLAATPVVWLAVIALPILAHRAYTERAYTASLLLGLAALIGTAYTLTGTVGRQSEARDLRVAEAARATAQRPTIERDLADAKAMLAQARAKCAKGSECLPATRYTIGVYEGAVSGHETRLQSLLNSDPLAGEKRVAAMIGLVSNRPSVDIERAVGLILPCLLGLLLEVAALACGMYGWGRYFVDAHQARTRAPLASEQATDDTGQSDYPSIRPADAKQLESLFRPTPDRTDVPTHHAPLTPDNSPRKDRILAAILTDLALGRTFPSQRDLSRTYGVARSTLSEWLHEWERSGMIPARRTVGRSKSLNA